MASKKKHKAAEVAMYLSCLPSMIRHLTLQRTSEFCSESEQNHKELELTFEKFYTSIKTLRCTMQNETNLIVTMTREFSTQEITSRQVSPYIRHCVWALGQESFEHKEKDPDKYSGDSCCEAMFLLDYIFQVCKPPTKSLQSLSFNALREYIESISSSDAKECMQSYLDWVKDENPTFSDREGDVTFREYFLCVPLESLMYDIYVCTPNNYPGPTDEQIKSFVYHSTIVSLKHLVHQCYGRHPVAGNNHAIVIYLDRLFLVKPAVAQLLVKCISDTSINSTVQLSMFLTDSITGYIFSQPIESAENLHLIQQIRRRLNEMKTLFRVQVGTARREYIEATISACITFLSDCINKFCISNRIST